MAKSVKTVIGVLVLIGAVAITASRLTVRHEPVGNRTALGAHSVETALSNYEALHGPSSAPRNLAPGDRLSGAINIGMMDGHAELARLERLWNLSWHLDWQIPATRPP
jgi:prepilin-type processing-associated H-X9-DG protein